MFSLSYHKILFLLNKSEGTAVTLCSEKIESFVRLIADSFYSVIKNTSDSFAFVVFSIGRKIAATSYSNIRFSSKFNPVNVSTETVSSFVKTP